VNNPKKESLMGDKKGKKDKAKGQRQHDAKQTKASEQKKDRQKPRGL
jgi:hypothetical protein